MKLPSRRKLFQVVIPSTLYFDMFVKVVPDMHSCSISCMERKKKKKEIAFRFRKSGQVKNESCHISIIKELALLLLKINSMTVFK